VESSPDQLREFYESGYSIGGEEGLLYARWRELGAKGKADHVLELLPPLGPEVRLLEVGCGDGALLAELRHRRPSWSFAGVEVASAACQIAAQRNPEADIRQYDGHRLPFGEDDFTVGVVSHVLEHVRDPAWLLGEAGRVCRWVVIEVPLEDNLSAGRPSARRGAGEIGHLHRFSRGSVREVIASAGLSLGGELTDPLPREVHRFFASSATARAAADLKWAVRGGVHRLWPAVASRLYTLHYAALVGREGGPAPG
jgi:SAM-dependent methyltransferase